MSAQSTQLFLENFNKWRTNPSQAQATDLEVLIYTILSANTESSTSLLKANCSEMMKLVIYHDSLMNIYSCSPIFYYLKSWHCRIVQYRSQAMKNQLRS